MTNEIERTHFLKYHLIFVWKLYSIMRTINVLLQIIKLYYTFATVKIFNISVIC